jgi:hypothetical protein
MVERWDYDREDDVWTYYRREYAPVDFCISSEDAVRFQYALREPHRAWEACFEHLVAHGTDIAQYFTIARKPVVPLHEVIRRIRGGAELDYVRFIATDPLARLLFSMASQPETRPPYITTASC